MAFFESGFVRDEIEPWHRCVAAGGARHLVRLRLAGPSATACCARAGQRAIRCRAACCKTGSAAARSPRSRRRGCSRGIRARILPPGGAVGASPSSSRGAPPTPTELAGSPRQRLPRSLAGSPALQVRPQSPRRDPLWRRWFVFGSPVLQILSEIALQIPHGVLPVALCEQPVLKSLLPIGRQRLLLHVLTAISS